MNDDTLLSGILSYNELSLSIREMADVDKIVRCDVNEEYAYSGYVEAGDFIFLTFCVGNIGESVERQIEGALDHMSYRLQQAGLTLNDVVKLDVLFRDVWDIPVMEEVFKRRFKGSYPARKTISTEFAHVGGPSGLKVQIDGIAYKSRKSC
ncbi:putative reactive intermediate deaminase TdcF [compost metagenome]